MKRPSARTAPMTAHTWGMLLRFGLWSTVAATVASEATIAGAVTEEPASPAAALQLREATARMEGLDALRDRARAVSQMVQRLAAAGESLRKAWYEAEWPDAYARASVQQASNCLALLRDELKTSDAAIDALLETIRR